MTSKAKKADTLQPEEKVVHSVHLDNGEIISVEAKTSAEAVEKAKEQQAA